MNLEPVVILVLVGAFGGAVRAVLGAEMQSDNGEKFNWVKALKSVLRASIVGSFLVYNTVDMSSVTGSEVYIGAFFASIGADVFFKEFYGTAFTKRKT
jgi:hypothetical protein